MASYVHVWGDRSMENVSEDEDRAIKEDGAEVAEEGIIHA